MLPAAIPSRGPTPGIRPAVDGDGTIQSPNAAMPLGPVPYDDFTEVALSCWNGLHFAARRLTRSSADADDLVQETYQLAFRNYRELRDLAKGRAWLHTILHRQAVTRYRRQHAGPSLVLDDAADDSEATSTVPDIGDPIEHLSLQEIRQAVEALPTDLRIAVVLCDIEGFTYAEIAELTNCPIGTVRSRIARARAKLMVRLRTQAEAWGIRCQTVCKSALRRRRDQMTCRLVA
ncbi:MAG TPA: sigma-70 family RNA polymerase sigma factor [Candidatus Kryptonia bacterium]|nr:sigma-70 family RNA polymerase sigma factor [Candidatus Kryptonia bacterium]